MVVPSLTRYWTVGAGLFFNVQFDRIFFVCFYTEVKGYRELPFLPLSYWNLQSWKVAWNMPKEPSPLPSPFHCTKYELQTWKWKLSIEWLGNWTLTASASSTMRVWSVLDEGCVCVHECVCLAVWLWKYAPCFHHWRHSSGPVGSLFTLDSWELICLVQSQHWHLIYELAQPSWRDGSRPVHCYSSVTPDSPLCALGTILINMKTVKQWVFWISRDWWW